MAEAIGLFTCDQTSVGGKLQRAPLFASVPFSLVLANMLVGIYEVRGYV